MSSKGQRELNVVEESCLASMSRTLLRLDGEGDLQYIHCSYPALITSQQSECYFDAIKQSVNTTSFELVLQQTLRITMAEKATTPPILQGPTAKEKKYDRQLRLWAASGQAALENAKVLFLNSNSGIVGVETLKNLILPGVGSFTIVDETNVSELDLGVNFFLEESSLGRWRAEETRKFLQELNPEVKINTLPGV